MLTIATIYTTELTTCCRYTFPFSMKVHVKMRRWCVFFFLTAVWLSYHLDVRFLDFFFSEKYCVPVLFYAGKILAIHSKKRKRFSIFFCESTAARVRGGISISHFLVFGCEYSQEEMRFGGRNLQL